MQQGLPSVQSHLLVPLGTELSQNLMQQAGQAFSRMPESTASQEKGETHEIANIFGACAQPGATAFSLLPVTLEIATGLTEMFALNIYMGIRLGRVASLTAIQSVLYMILSGPLLANNGKTFMDYIGKLYQGFSRTIVFAAN